MTILQPRDAAQSVVDHPELPAGDDERYVGYGVMGLPFASGHYLTVRHMPATTYGPPYRAVWHRDPDGVWTFYSTVPPENSCPRFFGAASDVEPVRCDIDIAWLDQGTLLVRVEGVLDWSVEVGRTWSTRMMSWMGGWLPRWAWTSRVLLSAMGRMAGPMLGVGRIRLRGTAPNGQAFKLAPERIWSVRSSRAVLHGQDLGEPGPLAEQPRLGGFWLPQKGIFAVGHGHFETFDADRHLAARPSERRLIDLGERTA